MGLYRTTKDNSTGKLRFPYFRRYNEKSRRNRIYSVEFIDLRKIGYVLCTTSTKNENRIIRIIAHRNCFYKCSIYNNVQQIITSERRKCNISIRHTRMDFDDIGYILRMISVDEIEYKYYHERKRDTC